jgi:hypothetical protein
VTRRLRDPELVLDDRAQGTGGLLTVGEKLQDPAAHRITKHIERMHGSDRISHHLYKSTPMSLSVISIQSVI